MIPPRESRERRTVLLVVLALAALIGLLHATTLFGGRIYHADDVGEAYWPYRVGVLRALTAGEIPDWEPRVWGGFPLSAEPTLGTFYPPNLVFLIFGAAGGVAWSVAGHQFVGGVAMLALLRRRRLALPAAAFGALSYALGTFSIERIRHLPFEQTIAWIPVILFGLDDVFDENTRRGIAISGLALGMICLAGAFPLVPFVAALALAYAIRPASRLRRILGGIGASLVLGACVGAAQLLPTLWHVSQSPRHGGLAYAFASRHAWPDLRWIVTLVAPNMWGVPHYGQYFGPSPHWELAGYYSGVIAVALAFVAPVRKKRELAALALLSVFAIGMALGEAGPIQPFLFRWVPIFRSLRCPARALVILVVTVPTLAAEGLNRICTVTPSRRLLRGSFVTFLVAVLFLVGVGLAPSAFGLNSVQQVATSHLILQLIGLSGAAAILGGRLSYDRLAWAAAGLVTIDLFTIGHSYLEPWDPEMPMELARHPAVQQMLSSVVDDRCAFGGGVPIGAHNFGLAADFRTIGGYDQFPVWRWVELLWIANTGHPYTSHHLNEDMGVGRLTRFDSPLVDTMNLRWLVSPEAPGGEWIEHTEGALANRHGLRLFENPNALPPAFLVHRVRVEPDPGSQAAAIAEIDPRREVVLERAPTVMPTASDEPALAAHIVSRTRRHLEIATDDPRDAILVISETMYPGWRAWIDGRRTTVQYANYAMRGIAVPQGPHKVEMSFEPPWGFKGVFLSLAGVVSAATLGLWVWIERVRTLRTESQATGHSRPLTASPNTVVSADPRVPETSDRGS
jgi:hypothetical protein